MLTDQTAESLGPNRRFEQPPASEDHVVPHSTYLPERIGTAAISPTGEFEQPDIAYQLLVPQRRRSPTLEEEMARKAGTGSLRERTMGEEEVQEIPDGQHRCLHLGQGG
jgi:hypothetical protein